MTSVASNVLVAVTGGSGGGARYAPTGTALPTTPSATPNVAFVDVGYISEDGISEAIDDSTTEIKAWQNADVVRRIQTDHSVQYKFAMIETNANVLSAYYGGNYTAGVVQIKSGVLPHKAWVLDFADGTNLIRIVIPDGQIVERGETKYANGEVIMYPVTIECYPDASGVKAYKYLSTSAVSQ